MTHRERLNGLLRVHTASHTVNPTRAGRAPPARMATAVLLLPACLPACLPAPHITPAHMKHSSSLPRSGCRRIPAGLPRGRRRSRGPTPGHRRVSVRHQKKRERERERSKRDKGQLRAKERWGEMWTCCSQAVTCASVGLLCWAATTMAGADRPPSDLTVSMVGASHNGHALLATADLRRCWCGLEAILTVHSLHRPIRPRVHVSPSWHSASCPRLRIIIDIIDTIINL